jgi:hypothetical protein
LKLSAQENDWYEKTFASYSNYIAKEFGVTNSIPEGFIDLEKYQLMRKIRDNRRVGNMYGPVFQTNDKECIVMYPGLPNYISNKIRENAKKTSLINRALNGDTSTVEPEIGTNNTFPRGQMTSEIKAATGLFHNSGKALHDSVNFNFNDRVTIIAGKKAKEMFNADSIFIYNLPLQKPYNEKYTYCVGMALTKQDRDTLFFKWFFTPEGKKRQKKYLNKLRKHVWYDEDFKHGE